jgi:hypothetical protein
MGKQYTLGCFSIYDGASQPTHIGGTNVDFPLNVEVMGNDSGALYEEFQSLTRVDPVATITTKNIAQVLSFIGLAGQCVGSAFDVTAVDVITRRVGDCQSALGGTPHMRDRVSAGLLTLGTLSASRGQDATITAMLDAITDGSNAPVARTDGVALPTPIVAERFTLGLPAIAGSTWPEIEDVSIEFNVTKTEKTPSLGSIWTDAIGVLTVRPVVTFRGRDLSKVSNALVAAGASGATHLNTVIQLIARENSGSFADFGDSDHIAITVAGLVVPENLVSASSNQRATNSIRLVSAYDGTNAPVLFDLSATYDTTPP